MRSFSILAILTLASSVLAVPHVARDGCLAEICQGPTDLSVEVSVVVPSITTPAKRLTNAERFARGLAPASPRRRLQHGTPVARDYPSSTPVVSKRGVIQVTDTDSNTIIGYLSKNSFSQAQYRHQPDLSNAMIVNFEVPVDALTASAFDINTENSDITTPTLLGLVEGRDNSDPTIASGSFQYGYFAATGQTPGGSPPSASTPNSYSTVTSNGRSVESAVWSIDLTTGALTAQWINPDSSSPVTKLFSQSTALYFGGDPSAFAARYPSPITNIALTFVSL